MGEKSVTRTALAGAVYRDLGISRRESMIFLEQVLEKVSASLGRGEQVKISSFGTFSVHDKRSRIGRNPKTGESAAISPRRVVSFRASHILRDRIDGRGRKPVRSV